MAAMQSSLLFISLVSFLQPAKCSISNQKPIEFNRTINIFTEYKPLVYAFNVSILKKALNETHFDLSEFCTDEIKHYETLLNRKLNDIVTMQYILDGGFEPERSMSRNTFSSLNYLQSDLSEFLNASSVQKCEIYKKLASDFTRIYFHIDRLSRGDYSLMDEIVNFQYLKHDTEKLATEFYPRNVSFPINFEGTLEGDFFSHVKFRLQFHKEFLYLIFSIPFYEKINLYTVSDETSLTALNWSKPVNFSTYKLDESCYYTKREYFCEKPEIKYQIADEIDLICFKKEFVNATTRDFNIHNNNLIITPMIFGCFVCSVIIILTTIKCMKINVRLSFSDGIVMYSSVDRTSN